LIWLRITFVSGTTLDFPFTILGVSIVALIANRFQASSIGKQSANLNP
jgi:hypothetical protein